MKKLYDDKMIRDKVEQMMEKKATDFCSQCGNSVYDYACGPSHVILMYERMKYDKEQIRLPELGGE